MASTRAMSTKATFVALNNASFFSPSSHKVFAVVGASAERSKFGNKVLRAYKHRDFACVPVNKKVPAIEGLACMESLTAIQQALPLHGATSMAEVGVSVVTPPAVTSAVIQEGFALGCRQFLLQPGTYDETVDATCAALEDVHIIKSCVLVDLDVFDD
jgi:predicted CoA-binding protein